MSHVNKVIRGATAAIGLAAVMYGGVNAFSNHSEAAEARSAAAETEFVPSYPAEGDPLLQKANYFEGLRNINILEGIVGVGLVTLAVTGGQIALRAQEEQVVLETTV